MRNTIAKITDFFDYVRAYKVNRENSDVEDKLYTKESENYQLKKRLSTFSIALKRSERIKVKYNVAIIEIARLKRDNELLETSRNRYISTCKKTRSQLNEANKKIKELEEKLQEKIERSKNGTGSV